MTEKIPKNKKRKGFFSLDIEQFFKIEEQGLGLEEAVAYLALIKGTDETNTISRGGINSIQNYTGLTRFEAKQAIDSLARIGLIEKLDVERARARTVPRYKLPNYEKRQPLAPQEATILAKLTAGEQPSSKQDLNAAQRARKKGWLEKLSTGWAAVPSSQKIAYIPNIFVHMEGQNSPLKRLVEFGELGPVMLAVELYYMQDLMNERGIPASAIRQYYFSQSHGFLGNVPNGYQIHELSLGRISENKEIQFDRAYRPDLFRQKNDNFWHNLKVLEKANLVEWAIYSANGKPKGTYDFNRPQRPLGALRNGKQVLNTPEAIVAFVIYFLLLEQVYKDSGYEIPDLDKFIQEWKTTGGIRVIENMHVDHIEGIGILRMVYRADTENTAEWFRSLHLEKVRELFFLRSSRDASFPELSEFNSKFSSYEDLIEAISTKFK